MPILRYIPPEMFRKFLVLPFLLTLHAEETPAKPAVEPTPAPKTEAAGTPAPASVDPAKPETPPTPAPAPTQPTLPEDNVRVVVLGYHDFAENMPETDMRMKPSKFRQQMKTIKDLGLNVISYPDFVAWKSGEKEIPDKSILITLDDGWKAVYTDAYPILKEMGFPFTLFLYKSYVDGGGRALTTPMIKELQENGAYINSHSVTHPFPGVVKTARKKGPEVYDAFLKYEMGESKTFLEQKFGQPVTGYAYPGGFNTEEMYAVGDSFGYRYYFTVLPGKVRRNTNNHLVPRYMILGTHDKIFDVAVNFNELGTTSPTANAAEAMNQSTQKLEQPVKPAPGELVVMRMPTIEADLSAVTNIKPETLSMKVGGFGEVPAFYDPVKKTFSWTVTRPLRIPVCQVLVTWMDSTGKIPQPPLRWTFRIDKEASYQPVEPATH
jgi:peptidoglycan/xylan/chitin deacetylase (PgdA/CDA1 family)